MEDKKEGKLQFIPKEDAEAFRQYAKDSICFNVSVGEMSHDDLLIVTGVLAKRLDQIKEAILGDLPVPKKTKPSLEIYQSQKKLKHARGIHIL